MAYLKTHFEMFYCIHMQINYANCKKRAYKMHIKENQFITEL